MNDLKKIKYIENEEAKLDVKINDLTAKSPNHTKDTTVKYLIGIRRVRSYWGNNPLYKTDQYFEYLSKHAGYFRFDDIDVAFKFDSADEAREFFNNNKEAIGDLPLAMDYSYASFGIYKFVLVKEAPLSVDRAY